MTTSPRVSVILPTFNRSQYLPISIGSVLKQSFRDLELLVVDDGSTEDVRGAVESFRDPRVRYLRQDRRGVAAARNAGVAAARGEYLAFQDSDDEWMLDKLELQFASAHEVAGGRPLVLCRLLRLRGRGAYGYPTVVPPGGTITHAQVLSEPFAYCQTWLVRREVLTDEGGFDESMRNWSDWEMLIRLSRRNSPHCITTPLVVSSQTPDSLTVVAPTWLTSLEHILDKHSSHMTRHPAALANLRYLHGRMLASAGQLRRSRSVLARNLASRPWHWRSAALLALSVGGGRVVSHVLDGRGA